MDSLSVVWDMHVESMASFAILSVDFVGRVRIARVCL